MVHDSDHQYNQSRHRAPHGDHKMFSRTASGTHWWNDSNWVPRGGRRF